MGAAQGHHHQHGLLVQSLAEKTKVNKTTILKLSRKFQDLAMDNKKNPNTISKLQFKEALQGICHIDIDNDMLMERIFELVDEDNDGYIFFKSFILGLSPYLVDDTNANDNSSDNDTDASCQNSPKSNTHQVTDEKVEFAFKLYRGKSSDHINKEYYQLMMNESTSEEDEGKTDRESMKQEESWKSSKSSGSRRRSTLTTAEVEHIFDKHGKNRRGSLTKSEFQQAAIENPALVNFGITA